MQVSLYLSDDTVKKVDRLARRQRTSRSKIVEILLERSLSLRAGGFASLTGTWQDPRSAAEIVAEIYRDRRRNRRADRVKL